MRTVTCMKNVRGSGSRTSSSDPEGPLVEREGAKVLSSRSVGFFSILLVMRILAIANIIHMFSIDEPLYALFGNVNKCLGMCLTLYLWMAILLTLGAVVVGGRHLSRSGVLPCGFFRCALILYHGLVDNLEWVVLLQRERLRFSRGQDLFVFIFVVQLRFLNMATAVFIDHLTLGVGAVLIWLIVLSTWLHFRLMCRHRVEVPQVDCR